MLTRSDYELLARELHDARKSGLFDTLTLLGFARRLSDAFERENPRFDRQRFLALAGYYDDWNASDELRHL